MFVVCSFSFGFLSPRVPECFFCRFWGSFPQFPRVPELVHVSFDVLCGVFCFVASLASKVLNMLSLIAICFSAFPTFRKIQNSDFRTGRCVNAEIWCLKSCFAFCTYTYTNSFSIGTAQWVCRSSVATALPLYMSSRL